MSSSSELKKLIDEASAKLANIQAVLGQAREALSAEKSRGNQRVMRSERQENAHDERIDKFQKACRQLENEEASQRALLEKLQKSS